LTTLTFDLFSPVHHLFNCITMTSLFSTPDEHAFDHPELAAIDSSGKAVAGPSSNGDAVSALSVEEAFEVDGTVRCIIDGGYKTVSLSGLRYRLSLSLLDWLAIPG
jgi:hypothetical protein